MKRGDVVIGHAIAIVRRQPGFIPVREPGTARLLFRFDPARMLIEIQRRGIKTVVDLTELDTEGDSD